MSPIDGVNAQIAGVSKNFPGEVLLGLNDREPQLHDVYRVDIATGERQLLQTNPGVAGFVADDDFNIRMGLAFTPVGGQAWLKASGEKGDDGFADWEQVAEFDPEDAMTSGPHGIRYVGQAVLLPGQQRPQYGRTVRPQS